jgi:hypothetical protein
MLHPLDQGLLALRSAFPDLEEDSADWPLGRRNRALAELRCAFFGAAIRGWTACRQCKEKIAFELNARSLAESETPDRDAVISVDGRTYRLPTSRDLAHIASEQDPQKAAMLLLQRCRSRSPLDAEDIAAETADWSENDLEVIGQRMAAADPLAEIILQFECPHCGNSFQDNLDLSAFLWAEIEGQAKRLLVEVHALASAYGWSEAEILALKRTRRDFYLEMVHA